MRIVFICGSLEPVKDGVGDYTRCLASKLISDGHQIAILALADKYISETKQELQQTEDARIPTLRVAANVSRSGDLSIAKNWIKEFNPSVLSIQFVPFAFDRNGLPYQLSKELADLGIYQYARHIMIHELWVGMGVEDAWKLKLWGVLQRRIIKRLLKTLKADVINTQSHLYEQHLSRLGFKAAYLPLFSNIPVIQNPTAKPGSQEIIIVLFGVIHKGAPVETFAKEAASYASEFNKRVHLIFLGRNGNDQQRWITAWKEAGLSFEVCGEKSSGCVSQILCNANFGIATTAYAVVDKSSSVAAMRSHGLPVLCVASAWTPIGIKNYTPPGDVINYQPGNLKEFFRIEKSVDITQEAGNTANALIASLSGQSVNTIPNSLKAYHDKP